MRVHISRNTKDQLIMENQPWLVSLFLVAGGLLFTGMGVWIAQDEPLFGYPFAFRTPLRRL